MTMTKRIQQTETDPSKISETINLAKLPPSSADNIARHPIPADMRSLDQATQHEQTQYIFTERNDVIMAKSKSIEAVRKDAEKVLTNRKQEMDGIELKISELNVTEQAAAADMQKASDSTDATAYSAAKRSRVEAQDAIEMYQVRLEKLQEDPAVPQDEFSDMVNCVISEMETKQAATIEKLADLTCQMVEVGRELSAENDEAMSTLTMLYNEIFPNWHDYGMKDMRSTVNGKTNSILAWSRRPAEADLFRKTDRFDASMIDPAIVRRDRLAASFAAHSHGGSFKARAKEEPAAESTEDPEEESMEEVEEDVMD